MNDDKIAYQGEVMLLGWSESNSGGRKVTFLLPPEDPEHPFKQFTAKQKGIAGQRFMAVLVQLNEQEQAVVQDGPVRAFSNLAAMLCKDHDFWRWLNDAKWMGGVISSEAAAKAWLCESLGIESRRELDLDKRKGEQFMLSVQTPFSHWRKTTLNPLQ